MRTLGGAITSPCSNDSGSRRHPLRSLDRSKLLFQLLASVEGTLWETARKFGFHSCILLACTVATHRILYNSCCFVSADRRATARTRETWSHAAIREKKPSFDSQVTEGGLWVALIGAKSSWKKQETTLQWVNIGCTSGLPSCKSPTQKNFLCIY